MNEKIKITDNTQDVVLKMSEGNPGAMRVIMELLSDNTTDPDNLMGGFGAILNLDSFGIYGSDIYILVNDICDNNIVKVLSTLRAVQLGLFGRDILKDACSRQDRSGKLLVPVEDLYNKVKEELPNFDNN